MIEVIFLNAAGSTLFTRSDMESGHWVQEEMSVNADFPYDPEKVIQRGQRIAFRDPATDVLQVFEIRQVTNQEPDHYQQITAEHIAVAELQDDHIDKAEITDKTASQALTTILSGTLWAVGTDTTSGTQSGDISRGSVWQAVNVVKTNWNCYITPRVVISAAGVITGRYLDIAPAQGTWRGVRLSVSKNLPDPAVTYNDEDVLTALYGYGGHKNRKVKELTFAEEVWTATADHPAKPSGQTYLEWPEKTALYGRNGRARFGYYQNSNIKDASVLLQKTWESLKRVCEPKISISGTAADLYRLGYADEPLRLHDLAIVEIVETGETFQKEISKLDVDLVDPTGNHLDIGDYIPNIIYINRDNESHSGGGGGGGKSNPDDEASYTTYSRWDANNERIGMVVGVQNGEWKIDTGAIVLAINTDGGTSIKLSADTIDIDGLITALSAKQISVGGLTVNGYSNFYNNANFHASFSIAAEGGNFTVFGKNATWQSKTVVTKVTSSHTVSRKWMYQDAQGNPQTQSTTMVTSVSDSSDTIYYLGRTSA